MREATIVLIVVVVSLICVLYLPYAGVFVFHTWDGAAKLDCEYKGGHFSYGTTTRITCTP